MKQTVQRLDSKFWMELLTLIVWMVFLASLKKKIAKTDIAKEYNISRPTLNIWIKKFYPELHNVNWEKKRKVTAREYVKLKEAFGFDRNMVLNKGQMCEEFSTSNKYLRKIIVEKGHTIGISIEVWNSCSIYPPSKTKKIQELLDAA